MYDKCRFFRERFFPNILKVSPDLRDVLTLHVLDNSSEDFDELIIMHACIPSSPHGETLKSPGQLVNPNRGASSLFCAADGRFPFGTKDTFCNPQRLAKLEQLGMVSDCLSWEEIAERAESISRLKVIDRNAAVRRVEALLPFIEATLKSNAKGPSISICARLREAKFLPVLQKPTGFSLTWKGDEFQSREKFLVSPKNVFLEEKKYEVCCTEPLFGLNISKEVKELFKLGDKDATVEHVMNQLEEAMSTNIASLSCTDFDEVKQICTQAYSFLQNAMTTCGPHVKDVVRGRRFILIGKTFLSADRVALKMKTDCSPYLYKLPDHLADAYWKLMNLVGVREQFEAKDYILSLQQVKKRFQEMPLDQPSLEVSVHLALHLGETLGQSRGGCSSLQGTVFLPDSRDVMRPLSELCIKDCPWMPDVSGVHFVNERISWSTCYLLGVKTRRQEALQRHEVGIPFGQREKLTNRLKRILTGYPCGKELLKELIQNADDAQATEICFINDPRNHPDERLFEDSWKALQGPALCVFNNSPFTSADIEGVQNLGEGSKGDNSNTTGQYGVGFNAVYHVTDVPSFRSSGEEIGNVLCVFDPHCKYVPNASDKEPGRMFKDIEILKRKFPDVFSCYLEDHFSIENATMFRFPLRSEQMAEESKISSVSVTAKKLDVMMENLKKELFEVLLFLNNVKKVTLCTIDESRGNMINTYSVEVLMSQSDDEKRQAFADCIKEFGSLVKEDSFLPTSLSVTKCSYVMTIIDNCGREEKWFIVQQVGFEKSVEKCIVDSFKEHQLCMLPRGGVACLLQSDNPSEHMKSKRRAYCFLPLPFETDLPVHINGHFALDHEARRHLWRDEDGGYRSDWNKALLRDVIPSCYLTLLDEVRRFLELPVMEDYATHHSLDCSKSTILKRLGTYEEYFPRFSTQDPHCETLVKAVYNEMCNKEMRLIPSVKMLEESSAANQEVDLKVTWFPLNGAGKDKTYFNDLARKGCFAASPQRSERESNEEKATMKKSEVLRIKQKSRLEEILLETGLNIVAFSMSVFDSLREAEVSVDCISPSAVMAFFKSFRSPDSLCKIEKIPCPVDKTPFKNAEGVICVLKYCKDAEKFVKNLEGMPLLLTQDHYLHTFSTSEPRCLSCYTDILPNSPSIFVHEEVRKKIFKDAKYVRAPVFRPLDTEIFASYLHESLPQDYLSEDQYVEWCPDNPDGPLPNRGWICTVWSFLQENGRAAVSKSDESKEPKAVICSLLSSLSKWCILPATRRPQMEGRQIPGSSTNLETMQTVSEDVLVPLGKADCVLDFAEDGISNRKLVDVLRRLGLPELNSEVINKEHSGTTSVTRKDSFDFARNRVASLKSPASLLMALDQNLPKNLRPLADASQSTEFLKVLEYFSDNRPSLTDVDKEPLRNMPFYPAASGGIVRLGERKGFILPDEIPVSELDVVESRLGCLFLKSRPNLSGLYEFLEVERVLPVEAYLKFILKCFPHFSQEGRLVHLTYIRQQVFRASGEEKKRDIDKEKLLDYLKRVEFIPTNDGRIMSASSLYDPHNEVFKLLLSEDKFPPESFTSEEWLPFLKEIGLVHEVSPNHFHRFATRVAHEAATARTEVTEEKSKALVNHLLSRPDVVSEGLLPNVCDIPFVAPHSLRQQLQEILPPFGSRKDSEAPFISYKGAVCAAYEDVTWTKAFLLPKWADPTCHRDKRGCPDYTRINDSCKLLVDQLQIVTKPSVYLVVDHCMTICHHLQGNSWRGSISSERCQGINGIMKRIYTFLQRNAVKNGVVKNRLQKTRCILVEGGKKFIFPSQAVLELYEDLEIQPYLYRVPPEFGKFQLLFEFLGCAKSVGPTHYAMVLEMLQKNCQNVKLHPNEISLCCKAVKGFFERMQEQVEELASLSKLYLPAVSSGHSGCLDRPLTTVPVSLQRSKDLIFVDAYANRIQRLGQPLVLDLSMMDVSCKSAMINYKELMMKLPAGLQPRMLSSVVKERLNPESTEIVTSGTINALRQQLSSAQFGRGIARLIQDVNSENEDFNEEVIAKMESDLRGIEICAVKNLKTCLVYKGVLVPESEAEVSFFQERLLVSGKNICKMYVNAVNKVGEPFSAIALVSHVIAEMYGGLLGKKAVLIPEMLRCPLNEIWSLLDTMHIRQDDTYNAAGVDIYPEPGTFIPIEDHHLLNDAFEEFEPREYVGYELDDPSLHLNEGVATYIYAVIIEEVMNKDSVQLPTKMYRINIGHNKEPVVAAADLYKFHRVQEISNQHTPRAGNENREVVFSKVSHLLEDAWKQEEFKRKQIVKRLYLQWHPDKNLGNERFCTEVFQHIQSEISRLGSSYDNYFVSWGARAREHGSRRKEYREHFSQEYGSWECSSRPRSWQSVLQGEFTTRRGQALV